MKLLEGKPVAEAIRGELSKEVATLILKGERPPHLAAILVGNNPASQAYIASKQKACEQIGFKSSLFRLDEKITEKELLDKISLINEDSAIDGLIVQLPLPPHIRVERVIMEIAPSKDVDGFHPLNIGRMVKNLPCYISATPFGILQLLERYNIETAGRSCVILGRSQIVGTPLSILLSRDASPGNCTVTLCHSKTAGLADIAAGADILVAALGRPGFVNAGMVREGAVVIDVGINKIPDKNAKSGYRLCGDVDFENVSGKCSYITPVPGGVGPMTIVSLLQNTLKAAKKEVIF